MLFFATLTCQSRSEILIPSTVPAAAPLGRHPHRLPSSLAPLCSQPFTIYVYEQVDSSPRARRLSRADPAARPRIRFGPPSARSGSDQKKAAERPDLLHSRE